MKLFLHPPLHCTVGVEGVQAESLDSNREESDQTNRVILRFLCNLEISHDEQSRRRVQLSGG